MGFNFYCLKISITILCQTFGWLGILSHQISILNYQNGNNFVIKLISEENDDQLILVKIEPESTLQKTIQTVQRKIYNQKSSVLEENKILKIHLMDLDINTQY